MSAAGKREQIRQIDDEVAAAMVVARTAKNKLIAALGWDDAGCLARLDLNLVMRESSKLTELSLKVTRLLHERSQIAAELTAGTNE